MTNRELYIKSKVGDYLSFMDPSYKKDKELFTCPLCKEVSASLTPSNNIICLNCNKEQGNIIDLVKSLEEDKRDWSNDSIFDYLVNVLNIKLEKIDSFVLDYYKKVNFDMTKIEKNGKRPLERDWVNKEHTKKGEWVDWLKGGYNLGLKTGKRSKVLVIDFDKGIPKEVKPEWLDTMYQVTNKGYHYIFKYDEDFPKTRIEEFGIDIETDGGQVVICPSVVNGKRREIFLKDIKEINSEFKDFLLSRTKKKSKMKIESEEYKDFTPNISEIKNLANIQDGNRHNTFMHLGGMLRQQLNMSQTKYVLGIINRNFCNPPLANDEFYKVIESLGRYVSTDVEDLANRILDFLRIEQQAKKPEIELSVSGGFQKGEAKQKVSKALNYLLKEELISRRGNTYKALSKAEWKTTFKKECKEVGFQLPYLGKYAIIRNGDLIVIGGKSGTGKTHLAMNIVKKLIEQGVTPYYISLESGSRFGIISDTLGINEGDFYWDNHYSPENIDLEDNAVTIVDWLLPVDYAQTDKIYEGFARQLKRKGGVLIIFTQLKGKEEQVFYAEDMVKFFASVVAKFSYDNIEGAAIGKYSKFETIKIRESKNQKQYNVIPTEFLWDSKELKEIEDEGGG